MSKYEVTGNTRDYYIELDNRRITGVYNDPLDAEFDAILLNRETATLRETIVELEAFLEPIAEREADKMQAQINLEMLHKYHLSRQPTDRYRLDFEDGMWYIIESGETVAEDYREQVGAAIAECKRLNDEYSDITFTPYENEVE